jgi:HEAT repeat protein
MLPIVSFLFARRLSFMMAAFCWLNWCAAAASNPERTEKLIAVLKSDTGLYEKARACQQLGEIGSKQAVPALASLLADEHLSAYARSGLEGIPDPSAAAALRSALTTLKGAQRVGVINSLGTLRDDKAVPQLRLLAADPDPGAAKAALLALGRIASNKAVQMLRKSLVNGPDGLRPEAATACLLAAETHLAAGRTGVALDLYDAVRNARVSPTFRAAATRGAILARKSAGPAFLVAQLGSEDRVLRNAALMTVREIPGDALANLLNTALDKAAPELQVQLLTALVDCHSSRSIPAIKARVESGEAEVRKTALAVLGQIGGPADAGFFLEVVRKNRGPEETALALRHLERLEGEAVDRQILSALSLESEAANRLRLIRLVSLRGITNAAAELFRQAADPDRKVCVAAVDALGAVAGPRELPALIAFARSCTDATIRESAGAAVARLCRKSTDPQREAELVLAEVGRATDPGQRSCWLGILTTLGCPRALPILRTDLGSANDQVAASAIEQLASWPDPAPVEDLLSMAETSGNVARRESALEAGVRLATVAADEHQQPDEVVLEWLRRADKAAQTLKVRRLVLSGLGRLTRIESFRLLAAHLADPALENEAVIPVVNMALAVARQGYAFETRAVLEKMAATASTEDLRKKARTNAAAILEQGLLASLFDGRSLAGWEGDTNVWRVRESLLVGGCLEGNPRNEFLATLRPYTNFVLCLEYKLVGTEGFVNSGVQFHSARLQQPAYEMAGFQADIGASYSGCLYDESRRNRFVARPADDQIKQLEKAGGWNRYEVRCTGPRIQILLNGVKTVDYIETDPAVPLSGLIALQIHGNAKSEVSFRSLFIQPL